MKKVFIITIFVFVSCSFVNESEKLKKALYNGNDTIETSMNSIAGKTGVVSYYIPKEQPTNSNFRRLGVKITKDNKIADYIIIVDTSANKSEAETLIFENKYKFTFNGKGKNGEGEDIWADFMKWGQGDDSWARTIYFMISPQFTILEK